MRLVIMTSINITTAVSLTAGAARNIAKQRGKPRLANLGAPFLEDASSGARTPIAQSDCDFPSHKTKHVTKGNTIETYCLGKGRTMVKGSR